MKMPVMILVGGRGTRLGGICDSCPKPMLPVMGRPFLAYLTDFLMNAGAEKIIFLGGYRFEQIEDYFKKRSGAEFVFLHEQKFLGTGGAVKNAVDLLHVEGPFLLLNGDSFTTFTFSDFTVRQETQAAILGLKIEDASRYGTLLFDDNGMLISFSEKKHSGPAVINAGVYRLVPELFTGFLPDTFYSLEKDFFPVWLRENKNIEVIVREYPFIDIGTPESLKQSEAFLRELKK